MIFMFYVVWLRNSVVLNDFVTSINNEFHSSMMAKMHAVLRYFFYHSKCWDRRLTSCVTDLLF